MKKRKTEKVDLIINKKISFACLCLAKCRLLKQKTVDIHKKNR